MALYSFGTRYNQGPFAFNPFNAGAWNSLSPISQEHYVSTPAALYGLYNQGLQQQGAPRRFADFADTWMKNQYGNFQGALGQEGDLTFWDYLGRNMNDLEKQYKYENAGRQQTRPTRFLRRV